MTNQQYTRLKEILEDHRRRLERSLRLKLTEIRAHNSQEGKVEAPDIAEASASDPEQEFHLALAELAAESLRQVDQTMARLERGDYGLCVECHETIAHNRLRALPFAPRCRSCEERRERGARRLVTASARHDDGSCDSPRWWERSSRSTQLL